MQVGGQRVVSLIAAMPNSLTNNFPTAFPLTRALERWTPWGKSVTDELNGWETLHCRPAVNTSIIQDQFSV